MCADARQSADLADAKRLDETIDHASTMKASVDESAARELSFPVSDISIPPILGNGDEPDGLRERAVDEGGTSEYLLKKKLDMGGYGVVFSSIQVSLNRQVAVKLLQTTHRKNKKQRSDFFKEAKIAGGLEHPNIVPIHDIGVVAKGAEAGNPFFVMKESDGTSWARVIREKTLDENLAILDSVLDAIGFAHSKGILHCDLKPGNVMVGEFGEVLVIDWGQAIDTASEDSFRPGGTPQYVSPEMAKYSLGLYSASEPAHIQLQIGPRTDVYLLGGILFEIVTGQYPHAMGGVDSDSTDYLDARPSQKQMLLRAAENQICDFSKHRKSELLDIALRALRQTGDEIESVAQFKEALGSYKTHRRSIEIRIRAFELLKDAENTSNYDTFQKAKLGFEESLDLREENPLAEEGLRKTRFMCAEVALKEQNFDLGIGMLQQADSKKELRLKRALETGKRRRDRRKSVVAFLSVAFAIAIPLGLYVVAKQKAEANTIIKQAKAAQEEADQAKIQAAVWKEKEQEAREKEQKAKENALVEKENAASAKEKEGIANQKTERARYRTDLIEVEQNISEGDFDGAKTMLRAYGKDTFESDRLNLLSHPELKRKPPSDLKWLELSGNRMRQVWYSEDQIKIYNTNSPTPVAAVKLKEPGVDAIAVSRSGQKLAIALQGQIKVVASRDLEKLNSGSAKLNGQRESITGLVFSPNGSRLLSVGKPNAIRKAAQLEHELMWWELVGEEWKAMGPTKFGGKKFTPTMAQFSEVGQRILALNLTEEGERQAIVLKQGSGGSKPYFERFALKKGVGYSVFADAQGTKVLSFVGGESSSHQLKVWSVDQPNNFLIESPDVGAEITRVDFYKDAVLAITEDKRSLYWNLDDSGLNGLKKEPQVFRGHAREIGFAGILESTNKFVTISKDESEFLATNVDTYRKESYRLSPASTMIDDESAATAFFESCSNISIIGNNHGLVSFHDLTALDQPSQFNLQTGAWEKHIVTTQDLFALSRRDYLYHYDLQTGNLKRILKELSSETRSAEEPSRKTTGEISSLEISGDGRTAVLQRNNGRFEFEIWDLDQPQLLQTINLQEERYRALGEDSKRIGQLHISQDGKWIAAAKVSVFLWKRDGGFVDQFGNDPKMEFRANSLRFVSGASKIVVSYENRDSSNYSGRIKLFDIENIRESSTNYKVKDLLNLESVPNLVDAAWVGGVPYVLVRRLVNKNEENAELGLVLIRLNPNQGASVIHSFPRGTNGSFFKGSVLITSSDSSRPIAIYDIAQNLEQSKRLSVSGRKRFNSVHVNQNDEFVLTWRVAGKNNTVSMTQSGQVGKLVVTAAPTVKAAGLNETRAVILADTKLRLWKLNAKENALSATPFGMIDGSYKLAEISPDAQKAIVVDLPTSKARMINFDDLTSEAIESEFEVTAAAWTDDSKSWAIGNSRGEIFRDGEKIYPLKPNAGFDGPVNGIQFAGDRKSMVIVQGPSGENGSGISFVLREKSEGQWDDSIQFKHADQDRITCADITADGTRVITGSQRRRVTIWDAEEIKIAEESVVSTTGDETPSSKMLEPPSRMLLTIGRLDSEVRSVNFVQKDSAVVALETNSPEAILFPTSLNLLKFLTRVSRISHDILLSFLQSLMGE